jgi:hypothetical protein
MSSENKSGSDAASNAATINTQATQIEQLKNEVISLRERLQKCELGRVLKPAIAAEKKAIKNNW